MTTQIDDSTTMPAGGGWGKPRQLPTLTEAELASWQEARQRLVETATRRGWTRAEASKRLGIPAGTLTPWLDGTYAGNYASIGTRVVAGLDAAAEQEAASLTMPVAPDYFDTRTSREIIDTLIYAQIAPEMVTVTLGAGMGKTSSLRHFAKRPHTYLVTMRPTTSGKYMMLQEFALVLDVQERSAARLDRAVGQKLKRNGRHTLLMVDEAQHLGDDAVNELRYLLDEYGVGIALVGNEEIHARWGRAEPRSGQSQIHRRIGRRIMRLQPYPEDITAQLDAWGIQDEEQRRLLTVIGRKPGALGQVDKTIRLASMLASGSGQPLSASLIKQAWSNRSGGEVHL